MRKWKEIELCEIAPIVLECCCSLTLRLFSHIVFFEETEPSPHKVVAQMECQSISCSQYSSSGALRPLVVWIIGSFHIEEDAVLVFILYLVKLAHKHGKDQSSTVTFEGKKITLKMRLQSRWH